MTDQLEKAAARVMILRVNFEVLGKVVDAVAEERNLHFRRPCIAVVSTVRPDDSALAVLAWRHCSSTSGPEHRLDCSKRTRPP